MQQYAKNAERGPPGQDGERQKMEHDSLKKEFDCLRKVRGRSHTFFLPLTHTRHSDEIRH